MGTIQFASLASGSSGNCYYLGNEHTSILIDAGLGIRIIKKRFSEFGLKMETLKAILVTHEHADHAKAVGCLGEKHHIPIYATRLVYAGMERNPCLRGLGKSCLRTIEKEVPFVVGDFRIIPFGVPHDSCDNVGYFIECGNTTFCLATDVGHLTETIVTYLCKADNLVLESNYDETMLRMGPYPARLKERILSPNGHLSNKEVAEFLANHYSPQWKYVWLCHLSKDNNHPELAYKTVETRLRTIGLKVGEDLQVIPLRRNLPTGVFYLPERR